MANLFHALQRRTPTEGRDPAEDFLTEAFAWLLAADPDLGLAFVRWLALTRGWPAPTTPPAWRTQEHLTSPTERGFVDMVAECAELVLLFEHKMWAPLHEDQLPKYARLGAARWGARARIVLVSAHRGQHTQPADAAITWADVHGFLSGRGAEASPHPLVTELLAYLELKGLGPPAPVSHQATLAYYPAQTFVPALTALFERLARDLDLAPLAALYDLLGSDLAKRPSADGERWGRLGLIFPHTHWRPGVFAGVVLDGRDLGVTPTRPELGPDFALLLSVNPGAGEPSLTAITGHPAFLRLQHRLGEDSGPWRCAPGKPPGAWFHLHLRRPLLDVLAGTRTPEGQARAMTAEIGSAVGCLLAGGELAEVMRDVRGNRDGGGA